MTAEVPRLPGTRRRPPPSPLGGTCHLSRDEKEPEADTELRRYCAEQNVRIHELAGNPGDGDPYRAWAEAADPETALNPDQDPEADAAGDSESSR